MSSRRREAAWPVGIAGTRGWPMPDGAWDDQCGQRADVAWLPWAVWQREPDWYVAFYTCDRGHAWTCGYGFAISMQQVCAWLADGSSRVSPVRIVPPSDYLQRHGFEKDSPLHLQVIDWSAVDPKVPA